MITLNLKRENFWLDLIDGVRKVGLKAYYGDASRLDTLRAAGPAIARIVGPSTKYNARP